MPLRCGGFWPHEFLTMWFDDKRRRLAGMTLAVMCGCLVAAPTQVRADTATGGAPSAATSAAPTAAGQQPDAKSPAELKVANRLIVTMRVDSLGMTPAERAEAVGNRLRDIVKRGGPLKVTTGASPDGMIVLVDGRPVFRVLNGDVDSEAGETVATAGAEAADNLGKALGEIREAEDAGILLKAVGYALLSTVLFVVLCLLLLRAYRWMARRIHDFVHRRTAHLLPTWTTEVMGEAALGGLFTLPVKLGATLLALLLTYQWAAFVLLRFPYTRPLGESLRDDLIAGLSRFGASLLDAVPGLLFVALIFLLARIAVRTVRAFFNGVERGHIHVAALDETTARPTGKLVTTGIWLLAIVAAYPYIPGSGSEAFKGIGVFVGLMMSIGASGVVSQVVSGLMLMYTRALRPGEFVQIGETEGTVKSVGFIATRVETLRHEEVNIPNSVIASSVTRNYSRLATEGGVWIPTKVTIGYDTPWRQVHALLELAASRTEGIQGQPGPRVLQTALQDYYVEYTLLVSLATPALKLVTLDRLHANIQDAFNEYGVQIMSPNYRSDPATPKIVPKEKWFEPPAAR
jgi:small-conductance mechanosensitive channel